MKNNLKKHIVFYGIFLFLIYLLYIIFWLRIYKIDLSHPIPKIDTTWGGCFDEEEMNLDLNRISSNIDEGKAILLYKSILDLKNSEIEYSISECESFKVENCNWKSLETEEKNALIVALLRLRLRVSNFENPNTLFSRRLVHVELNVFGRETNIICLRKKNSDILFTFLVGNSKLNTDSIGENIIEYVYLDLENVNYSYQKLLSGNWNAYYSKELMNILNEIYK